MVKYRREEDDGRKLHATLFGLANSTSGHATYPDSYGSNECSTSATSIFRQHQIEL